MRLETELADDGDEYSEIKRVNADVFGIRVECDLRDGVAIIQTIKPKDGFSEVYGEWVSAAFTLLQRHEDVDYVEFVAEDNIIDDE